MLRTPKADEVVVIYETRKNRVSGAHTQVIDDRPNGGKYILRCVDHDYKVARNVRLATEAESHKSHEWCPKCTDVRPHDKKVAAPLRQVIELNAAPDVVKVFSMPAVEQVVAPERLTKAPARTTRRRKK